MNICIPNGPLARRMRLCGRGAVALGALLLPVVHAQSPMSWQDSRFYYGGLSLGQSRMQGNGAELTSLLVPGVSASSIHRDREDAAYKLFGGYQVNRHLAVEAGYFDLGRSHFDATTVPLGRLTGQTKVRGVNLDLVGTMPLTERLSAQARVGAQYARSSSEFSGTVAVGTVAGRGRHSGTNLKLGLGVQYALSPAMWIRGEVEHYRTKNFANQSDHINVVSLSLVFPFGRAEPTRMASAPMPMKQIWPSVMPGAAMVVAAAEAAPLVALAVARQRVSFSAETLFGFDASAIGTDGQTALHNFGREINRGTYESISVQEHADRLGSTRYNEDLSTRRAESVKTYLVDRVKLDTARNSALGYGEEQPMTEGGSCPSSLDQVRLIACLQADRRVELEVTGAR